jgi:hypothetical protein
MQMFEYLPVLRHAVFWRLLYDSTPIFSFRMGVQVQVSELDALNAKTDVAANQLEALRQTSVLEDCFHIWYFAILSELLHCEYMVCQGGL